MEKGGKLIKLKTDCVVIQDGNDVMCKEGIGNFRVERVPREFSMSYPFYNDYSFSLKVMDWRMETNPASSRLLCGRAGTGKTHQLRLDLSKLTDYVVTATTNKAATIINGQTIHKFLGIDQDASSNIKSAIKVARKYKYIIIDEISMLPAKIYEILYEIKLRFRTKVKFIFVGDYDQLPPVEAKSYNYFNSVALKELVEFNIQQLTENKRSDSEMWDLFQRVDELNPEDFRNSLNTRVHLCYTNVKRKEINELMMKQDNSTRKNLINVDTGKEQREKLPDTDHKKLKQKEKQDKRDKDPLHKKRKEALVIINQIIRGVNISDDYCLKHTFKMRVELLDYLDIHNGVVPKGYEIDHIKPRHQHVTDKDFEEVNAYWNLRLLSRNDNNSRNRL
jgi:hypothetical protein